MIPEAEREARCLLSSDQCVIDGEHFYIVGNLEIPVVGVEEIFAVDVLPGLRCPAISGPYPHVDGTPPIWRVPPMPLQGD